MSQSRLVTVGLAAVAAAAAAGLSAQEPAPRPAADARILPMFRPEDPPGRSLDANLYMQTSAEYRACCLQAFALARLRLERIVADSAEPPARLAVILDLDETVIDNSAFQSMMIRSRLAYDQRLWDIWEAEHWDKWALVPGAKGFIEEARRRGVTVGYLSNRNDRFREQTMRGLERLGIQPAHDADLKLATDTSDKTRRRADIEAGHRVVLLVGDNLRDFSEEFRVPKLADDADGETLRAAIRDRKAKVDAHADEWGDRWIILPNPAYGEWAKPLDRGSRDVEQLVPE
ncbi:MAG: 5'-nucleotidase, lipoprotein e(P4) family [Planctomycetaceae bacterium]